MDHVPAEVLRRTIRDVRRRYRLRVALRGAAFCLLAVLVTFAVSAYGMDHFRYSPWAVAAFRVFAYAAVLGLLLRLLALPLLSRVSDEEVALYLEQHEPSLDAALLSAVEGERRAAQGGSGASPALVVRLVESAVERVERIDYGRLVERPRLNRFAALLAGSAAVGMLGALLSPAFVQRAAPYLLAPWSVRAASPYSIEVTPGSATLARGADQLVTARLQGFTADTVELVSKDGDAAWKREAMVAEPGSEERRLMLLAVSQPTEYFVESSGVRSAVFRLDVVDRPYVKRIDLEYLFPAYTGLSPVKVEDGGDVAALQGTEVVLRITPTLRVAAGRLRIEGAAPVSLAPEADGTLSGRFRVLKDGFYKIELPGSDGRGVAASPDYAIEALLDQPPSVAFAKPGRDVTVTPIEEVFAEVKAEDDYGVSRLELVYSVNGGPEKTVALHQGRARKFVSAGHTFFLEEVGLETGDFVSYFARAADAGVSGRAATSDIYFLEARPFRRDYRQAEQAGQDSGGGAGQREGALSAQQRQVIAATFRLVRDRGGRSEKDLAQDLATVALVQGRLRAQVEQLLARMGTRGVLETAAEMHKTAEELRQAVGSMQEAETSLGRKQPREALPPEQRALAHLQRAEGAFRDVQVAFGQRGGGGGASGAQAEELADLFELELDKLRNQYETVQRGERERADNEVDEALARLQELARRQEAENERRRARGARAPNQAGGGGGSQRELAEEAEELGRRLERLARERTEPGMQETARRLREAASSMRRSAAGSQGGQTPEGQAALDQLKEASRQLQGRRQARLDRDLREAQGRAQEMRSAQERIGSEVREARASAGGAGGEQAQRLRERKDQLAAEAGELEQRLDAMAREARREQKEASRKLQEAANAIRDEKLKEKIRYSKGLVTGGTPEVAEQFEADIASQIGGLERRLREAAAAVGQGEDAKRAAALEKARDLVRNLESFEDRLRSAARGEPRERGSAGAAGERRGQASSPEQQAQASGRQGEEQGGGRPGEREAADRSGAGAGGGPRGALSGEDARQLRRELRERATDAQGLQRELQRSGLPSGDVEGVAGRLRALDSDRRFGDPLGLARLTAEIVEDLKLLEYALRREAEGGKPKLYLSGSEELPPGYKALVEEYYRSLARQQK